MAKKKEAPNLVVKSVVKTVCGDVRISGDFYDALNDKLKKQLDEAMERCKANGRSTLRPHDL